MPSPDPDLISEIPKIHIYKYGNEPKSKIYKFHESIAKFNKKAFESEEENLFHQFIIKYEDSSVTDTVLFLVSNYYHYTKLESSEYIFKPKIRFYEEPSIITKNLYEYFIKRTGALIAIKDCKDYLKGTFFIMDIDENMIEDFHKYISNDYFIIEVTSREFLYYKINY